MPPLKKASRSRQEGAAAREKLALEKIAFLGKSLKGVTFHGQPSCNQALFLFAPGLGALLAAFLLGGGASLLRAALFLLGLEPQHGFNQLAAAVPRHKAGGIFLSVFYLPGQR
jgi:hypothetical protein